MKIAEQMAFEFCIKKKSQDIDLFITHMFCDFCRSTDIIGE